MHDKIYAPKFSDIWLWSQWPGNNGMPDTGIDIVAKFRENDSYCAVQCKFRQDDSAISKGEIDSFMSLSSKSIYSQRILFALTDDFNDKAKDTLTDQNPPVKIITLQDLANSSIKWEEFSFENLNHVKYKVKTLLPHQITAVNDVLNGLARHDRGKLIMACGTGKTFTSLKIAEKYAGRGSNILVLVPSISLLNQSITSWNYDHDENLPLISLPVCSDSTAGYEPEDLKPEDLTIKPTTNAANLIHQWQNAKGKSYSMCVVFSTYQSLNVIHDAQAKGFPMFDLVICDEAHRTAGIKKEGKKESQESKRDSSFRLIHENSFIHARKRLYMTATPKIFGETAKIKAVETESPLYSMDDEKIFGPELYRFSFSDAIEAEQLSDYKVIVFTFNFNPEDKTRRIIDDKHSYSISDTAKIIGIRKALAKELDPADKTSMEDDLEPMKSAVVFTNTINESETFRDAFRIVTQEEDSLFERKIECGTEHIDGSDSVSVRAKSLQWLNNVPENSCHILSNARCLSEGVDVPALDAVVFFRPKQSEIDIVQSVGRVMRKAEGKKFGYVIVPIAVRPGVRPEEELEKNKEYQAVWKILKALRSHDNTFQSVVINELRFNGHSKKIVFVPPSNDPDDYNRQIDIDFSEWEKAITAKIVEKCGDREYWDKWTADLRSIAEEIERNIRNALTHSDTAYAFGLFIEALRKNINNQLTDDNVIDMLTQHMITERVFNAFFSRFSQLNPVSQAMNNMINALKKYSVDERLRELQNFYRHVYISAQQAVTSEQRQKFMIHLYEDFFKKALPKTAEKFGIVYTSPEIVNFILKSTDWALREKLAFNDGLSSPDVRILDPFSGTGTFIAQLITSDLISRDDIGNEYHERIFANEILPLAYYISAVNIESAYMERAKSSGVSYVSFQGMALTDTFMQDNQHTISIPPLFHENGMRIYLQEERNINVIIGNPPYSVGQKNANDNNQNTKYDHMKARINDSYAKLSTATNKNSLYDSYILAFRWASDRLKNQSGVICFVTNGSFIDSNSADGMRKCLRNEFTYIYIYNLRGNANTSGERRRNEGDGIFGEKGEGSKCPAAITLLVRDINRPDVHEIYYYECGDCMKRDQKLDELVRRESFGAMMSSGIMREIIPNDFGDWVKVRGELFGSFMRLGNKKERNESAVFDSRYSAGVKTNRDTWCYNFSRESLCRNMAMMIDVYNSERERWQSHKGEVKIEDFVTNDPAKISWTDTLYRRAERNEAIAFRDEAVRVSMYRPYVKEYTYFSHAMNERVYQMPSIFPETDSENLVICIPGIGNKKVFSVLMTDTLPSLSVEDASQCFPLYWYEREESELFGGGLVRHDGISDEFLREFRTRYDDGTITKRDIFFYIYGVLSSREYAARFGTDASMMLARVPFVNDSERFYAFMNAGYELAMLHVNYESVDEWPVTYEGDRSCVRIQKMRIITRDSARESVRDSARDDVRDYERVIRVNDSLVMSGIPSEAWRYVVNGRSALEWIVERYCDSTDKDSGIRNDCNMWGIEHGNESYVLNLIARVVRVSVESVRIIEGMPEFGL